MPKSQARDRLRHTLWFVGIQWARFPVRDRAVWTIAGAHIAQQHEGRGAVRKALADVRTTRLLAHRMESELGENRLGPEIFRRNRRADLDPVWMLSPRFHLSSTISLGSSAANHRGPLEKARSAFPPALRARTPLQNSP